MKKQYLLVAVLAFMVPFAGCLQRQGGSGVEKGYIEGRVTIGPICPVEREGVPCDVPPAAYEARKIVVYDKSTSKVAAEISLDANGNYGASLEPGVYIVDINRLGIDRSSDVPKEVRIEPGRTMKLDIDIDTGIR